MKRIISLMLVVLAVQTSARADGFYDRGDRGYDRGGGFRPGPGDDRHDHGRPPMRPPPYSDIYGPARTARWLDMGSFRAEKILLKNIRINAGGQYVNEILIDVIDNNVQIDSAVAYLTNGQIVNLQSVTGVTRKGRRIVARLDYRNSLRVDRIEMNIETAGLFGPRGNIKILLGVAN